MSKDKEVQRIPVGPDEKLIFETTKGKEFVVSIGKEKTTIRKSDLMGLLFLFADKKQQEDLITATEVKMKPIARLLTFKLDKDMKAGEAVKAFYQYLLPVEYADKLIKAAPHKYKEATITIDEVSKELQQIEL